MLGLYSSYLFFDMRLLLAGILFLLLYPLLVLGYVAGTLCKSLSKENTHEEWYTFFINEIKHDLLDLKS